MSNKIYFLGNGGGRFVSSRQIRRTAGFFLELDNSRMFVDPGPGALVYSRKYKIPLEELDVIFASHKHTDHYTDAEPLIEAMTRGGVKKRGTFLCPRSLEEDSVVSEYHKSLVKDVVVVGPGSEYSFKDIKLRFTKTFHSDINGVGFVCSLKNGLKISYTSDGKLTEDVMKEHKDSDIVIFNSFVDRKLIEGDNDTEEFVKSKGEKELDYLLSRHMDIKEVVLFLERYKPRLALLRHFSLPLLRKGDKAIAKEIEEKTKVRTIALQDSDVLDLDRMEITNIDYKETSSLNKFIK